MPVYKTKLFSDWQKKEGVPDKSLCVAVCEMSRGLIDANLGGGLLKKRIACPRSRSGAGVSSDSRTLLATYHNDAWYFLYGFFESERDNIDNQELLALKRLAAELHSMATTAISKLLADNELKEICEIEK